MAAWYPGAMTYTQWCQANSFFNDFKSQSRQIRESIHEQSKGISDQTRSIVASNEQVIEALENGYNQLSKINEEGFDEVASAIEAMHCELSSRLGIIIQKLEYQNTLLNSIHHTLETPFETKVKELYNNGCKFVRQENFDAAIECFKESISLKLGKYFFPSYYQLGRLYLYGKVENKNVIDPIIAMRYLMEANDLGNGIVKDEISFEPILADCKFYLSQSFYFQLSGKNDNKDLDLLKNAIRYCEEAISINPNLSQAYYHLSQYYAYVNIVDKLLENLGKAIEIHRDYMLKYEEVKVFGKSKPQILAFLTQLKEQKRESATQKLKKAKSYINTLESKGISRFQNLNAEFQPIKKKVHLAEMDFQTETYFGFDDCLIKLGSI